VREIIRKWFALAGIFMALSGCGYRLAGHQALHGAGEKTAIAIPVFANKSLRPNLEACLTARLVELFAARGGGRVVPVEQADLELSGAVLSYGTTASAYSAADLTAMYQAAMTAEATLRQLKNGTVLWKGTVSARQEYPANSDLALQLNAEEAAQRELCRKLAEEIMRASSGAF